jgi:hypothetical protein
VVDFSTLGRERLEAMLEAGREAVNCHRVLAKSGDNIVGELLKGHETFFEWDHYPSGDVYDRDSHSQYYYHAHPQEERIGEHGHFHTFLRPKGMPDDIRPARIEGAEMPEDLDDWLSHLIGISMDKHGIPIRLFTTNRWVTGEVWYEAADVCRMLDLFEIDLAPPSWPVNCWLTAMVRLFRPQIEALIHERDVGVARWAEKNETDDVYEDRRFEIVSSVDISIDDQVAALVAALERA